MATDAAYLVKPRPDLLTRAEAAIYVRSSVRTLSRVTAFGPTVTRIGRKVFYTRADLDAWLARNRSTKWRKSYP